MKGREGHHTAEMREDQEEKELEKTELDRAEQERIQQ